MGRAIRWTTQGLEIEGEVKYFKALVKELGMENGKSVDTPWTNDDEYLNQTERLEMKKLEATMFRRSAARIN